MGLKQMKIVYKYKLIYHIQIYRRKIIFFYISIAFIFVPAIRCHAHVSINTVKLYEITSLFAA